MKIELKRVKISKRQSQETLCFVADLWIDGKLQGSVMNDGHGGMCRFSPPRLQYVIGPYCKAMPEYAEYPESLAADFYIANLAEDKLS